MAKITADNYVRFDAYCRGRYGMLSPRQEAQVALLKEQDQICRRCLQFPITELRCKGTRLIFQPDESVDPERLVLTSCHKLDRQIEEEAEKARLESAGLAASRVKKLQALKSRTMYAHVEKRGVDLYFDGKKLQPLIYNKTNDAMIADVWGYIYAMVQQGFKGIYFCAYDYCRAQVAQSPKELLEKLQTRLIDCDWLVFDMLDYSFDITYVRDAMFLLVKTRISYCRPTMLIVSKTGPQWETVAEKEFFEEASKWPKLNLP